MQAISRQVGKYTNKRTEDKGDVGGILQEFKVADELLDHFMDAVRSFQNGWKGVLAFQMGIAREYESLYSSKDDPESRFSSEVDAAALDRASRWHTVYAELEKDLAQETEQIQSRLLNPAMDAKQSIAPLKKVIKKRDNYKLDYERYQQRVDHARQKGPKSARDESALVKHEGDSSAAFALYQSADDQIRKAIPAVVDAIQKLIPLLLNEQILLQHTLVGQLYTVLHNYCQQMRFPSPAPPMEQVLATWEGEFTPMREEIELSMTILSSGKAVRQPMSGPEKAKTVTGLSIRSRLGSRTSSQQSVQQLPQVRRSSSNALMLEDNDEELPPPKPPRSGSASLSSSPRPRIGSSTLSTQSIYSHQNLPEDDEAPPPKPPRPGMGSSAFGSQRRESSVSINRIASPLATSGYGTPFAASPMPTPGGLDPQRDYFTQHRAGSTTSIASSIASKKKPPPPPVKRRESAQELVVTALYDFAGQGEGDLVFREGDRIVVTKRTASTDDWWEGTLRGTKGNFPANYVQLP